MMSLYRAAAAVLLVCATSGALARGMTVDDLLSMESLGRGAEFVLSDRALVYERTGAYSAAPNLASAAYEPGVATHLWIADLTSASSYPQPLFRQDDATGYWIGGVSPDRTQLAIYALSGNELKAGVVDLRKDQREPRWLPINPSYSSFVVRRPVWLSDDELVYATLPAGAPPALLRLSGLIDEQESLWRQTWEREKPAVTVDISTPDGLHDAGRFREGALVRVNARTGEVRTLAQGYFRNMRLSADGTQLAALREGGLLQSPVDSSLDGAESTVRRWQLIVVDLRTGQARTPCAECNALPGSLVWSSDGKRLYFLAHRLGTRMTTAHLYMHERSGTQDVREVPTGDVLLSCGGRSPGVVQLAEVGGALYALGNRRAEAGAPRDAAMNCSRGSRSDWYRLDRGRAVNLTERYTRVGIDLLGQTSDGVLVEADGEVLRLSARGVTTPFQLAGTVEGELAPWSAGAGWRRRNHEGLFEGDPPPPRRQATLFAGDDIIVLDLLKLKSTRLKVVRSKVTAVPFSNVMAIASDGQAVMYRTEHGGFVESVMLARATAEPTVLDSLNPKAADIELAQLQYIEFKYADGSKGGTCLMLPTGYQPGRRYPLIVEVYPDRISAPPACFQRPANSLASFTPYSLEIAAAAGYVVVQTPAPRALSRTAQGPNAGATPLVLAAVDAAIAAGYVDPDRLMLYGYSQGMHQALRVLMDTSRFKAAVVMNGIADFGTHYADTPLAYRFEFNDEQAYGAAWRYENTAASQFVGKRPWESPQLYTDSSAIYHADRIVTPLMIVQNDFDIFPSSQAVTLFGTMRRLRRDAQLVQYWGESHWLASPPNIRDWWARVLDWYARHDPAGER